MRHRRGRRSTARLLVWQDARPAAVQSRGLAVLPQAHLLRAHEFYERHGGKALILARFIPIVRTFAPVVAGMAAMNYPRFILYTMVGAVVWASA